MVEVLDKFVLLRNKRAHVAARGRQASATSVRVFVHSLERPVRIPPCHEGEKAQHLDDGSQREDVGEVPPRRI